MKDIELMKPKKYKTWNSGMQNSFRLTTSIQVLICTLKKNNTSLKYPIKKRMKVVNSVFNYLTRVKQPRAKIFRFSTKESFSRWNFLSREKTYASLLYYQRTAVHKKTAISTCFSSVLLVSVEILRWKKSCILI